METETKPDVPVVTEPAAKEPVIESGKIDYSKYVELLDEKKKVESKLKAIADKEQKEKEEKAKQAGEFETLYKSTKSELEAVAAYKEKYEQLEVSIKTELISQLPKDRQKSYEGFTVEQLRIVIKDLAAHPHQTVGTEGTGTITADTNWDDLTEDAKANLFTTNSSLANKLMIESINKKKR